MIHETFNETSRGRGRPRELVNAKQYSLMLEEEDLLWLKAKGTYQAAKVVRTLIRQQRVQETQR